MGKGRKAFSPARSPRIFDFPGRRPSGSVLFHDERPDWVYLNPEARDVLLLSRGGFPPREIARILGRRFAGDPARIERDVRAVLADLKRRGFGLSRGRTLRRIPRLKSLQIHVTERCNLSCVHCHFAASPGRTLDMPEAAIRRLVDEASDLGAAQLTLSGGEPLLHPGLRRIMRYARGKMSLRLATNGTLIDDGWAAFLAGAGAQIQVSLDGPDARSHDAVRGRGAFELTLRAVERMQKAGLGENLTLSATIQSDNIGRLDEMIAMARRLGVPRLRFLPLRRKGRAARNWGRIGSDHGTAAYRKFYDTVSAAVDRGGDGPRLSVSCGLSGYVPYRGGWAEEDGFWCFVGTTLAVAADGKAYPCVLLMEDQFLLGDVHRESLGAIVRSRSMARACGILAGRRKEIPGCAACLWNNFCQAGCMGLALDHKGTVMDVDRFCAHRKKIYRQAFRKLIRHASAKDKAVAKG